MYRAILLDLGNVLIELDFAAGYRALAGLCPYAEADIRRRIAATDLPERFETGLIEPRDQRPQPLRAGAGVGIDERHVLDLRSSTPTHSQAPSRAAVSPGPKTGVISRWSSGGIPCCAISTRGRFPTK